MLSKKNCGSKKFRVRKNFGCEKNFEPKILLAQKNFWGPKKCLGPKTFLGPKISRTKYNLGQNYLFGQKSTSYLFSTVKNSNGLALKE